MDIGIVPEAGQLDALLPQGGDGAVGAGGAADMHQRLHVSLLVLGRGSGPVSYTHLDVQPALVDAEGFHQIGVLLIELVYLAGELPVLVVVGGKENQPGTLFPGLPDGLRGLDTEGLGRLVFCQDDAVAAGRVAAHRHWEVAQLRVLQQLHRGVKAVQITVKDDTVHRALPPY